MLMFNYHPLLEGAIDLHTHSFPSVFTRKQTDWELVEDVKAAGMAGIVIKSHEASTADRTALIRMKEPDLHIYGGLVCNHYTGGLNPAAVDVAIQSGAKIIWMPTISSCEHQAHFALKKTRFFQSAKSLVPPMQALSIFDEKGYIKDEVHVILELIAEANIVLATGHLSPNEVLALTDAAKQHSVQKVLIQHTDLGIARIRFELERELVAKGAVMEKCYLACSSDFADITVEEMAHSIRQLGAQSCVLVTDYGQEHNIPPVQAFNEFVGQMAECGLKDSQIGTMIVNNPRDLLGV